MFLTVVLVSHNGLALHADAVCSVKSKPGVRKLTFQK